MWGAKKLTNCDFHLKKKNFRVSNPKTKLSDEMLSQFFFLFRAAEHTPHTFFNTKTRIIFQRKMTINDHDQFTGLNAVHVAASEGNVKKLVELMDDGAELDVPALGGAQFTSRLLFFYNRISFFDERKM